MESKLGIRILLIVAVIVALLTYHGTNALLPSNGENEFFLLVKIAQILALIIVTLVFATNKWVGKFIFTVLGEPYIGGAYAGNSWKGDTVYTLELRVKQSLYGASAEAQSTNPNGVTVSNWTGTLFKKEGNKYHFGISLDSRKGPESGVLDVAFNGGSLTGHYRPAHHDSEAVYQVAVTRK
jgi:hypothetical protein